MGELNVGEMHTSTLQTHANMQSPHFFGGYYLPPVHPCVNCPLSFYGASALNVYPLQNDPPLLIELVRKGGQLVVGGVT